MSYDSVKAPRLRTSSRPRTLGPYVVWFALLVLLCLALYLPAVSAQRFGDDLGYIYNDPLGALFRYFWHQNPFGFYRPLEATFLALVQLCFGTATWPIHVVHVFALSVMSCLVFVITLRIGGSRFQACIASLFLTVTQANVSAVLGNDTSSQVFGALFRALCLFSLYQYFWPQSIRNPHGLSKGNRTRFILRSNLFFVLALLSKETSVSLLLQVAVVSIIAAISRNDAPKKLRNTVLAVAPFFAIVLIYMSARYSVVTDKIISEGTGGYQFHLGANLATNFAMYIAAAAVPVSSVRVYSAFTTADRSAILILSLVTTVSVLLGVWGWHVSTLKRTFGVFLLLGALVLTSTVPLNHVSELHVYDAMPFFSVAVGAALGSIRDIVWPHKVRRMAYVSLLAAIFVSHIVAVKTKTAMLLSNGRIAAQLLDEIVPYAKTLPRDGELILVNPPTSQPEYSVYLLNGFNVLSFGGRHRIRQLSGRSDVSVTIMGTMPPADFVSNELQTMLTLRNGTVVVYP